MDKITNLIPEFMLYCLRLYELDLYGCFNNLEG